MYLRKLVANGFLGLAGVMLALLGLEGLLRLFPSQVPAAVLQQMIASTQNEFEYYQYDETLGWVGRPNASGQLRLLEASHSVDLNARGERGPLYAFERRPGSRRVLVLGDSMTWGYGVDQPDAYPARLETLLVDAAGPVEVVNLAVTGYGADQGYLTYLHRGRQYQPDLVVLAFAWNDVDDNAEAVRYGYPKPHFELVPDGTLRLTNVPVPRKPDWSQREETRPGFGATAWYRFKRLLSQHLITYGIVSHVVKVNPTLQRVLGTFEQLDVAGGDGGRAGSPERREAVALSQALVMALVQAVRQDGARSLVVFLPNADDASGARPNQTLREMASWCARELGPAVCLDLRSYLAAAGVSSGAPLYFRYDGGHFTASGHAAVAQAIADHIRGMRP